MSVGIATTSASLTYIPGSSTSRGRKQYIQREEAVTKAKLANFRSGATVRPRRRRMQEKEKRIQRLFDRFNGGTITLEDYIDAIKHQTGL